MVCNSILSLFLSPILVVVLFSLSKEIYLHQATLNFTLRLFKKKNMIGKTSFFSHKSPCLPLKIFKLMNKREEQSNNVGKTVVIFPHIFRETLGALVHLSVLKRAFVSVKFVFFNFNINKCYNFFTNFVYGEKRFVTFFYNVPFLLKLDSF